MENCYWWKLPSDIQSDILNRLTGKTLISLKSVSWGWYNLISYTCIRRFAPSGPDSYFLGFIYRERLSEGDNPPSTLKLAVLRLCQSNFRIPYIPLEDRLSQYCQPEDIQDCCNGILLAVHHHNDGAVRYSVFNPTTGESIQVPPPPPHSYHSHHIRTSQCCFASLAFEPTKSFHFKIVCTPGGSIRNPLMVETFSSETGKWLGYAVNIDSVIDGSEWIHRSAYLEGRIYRLLKTNYLACIDQGKSSQLLSVQAIELPSFSGDNIYIDENNCYGSIGISRRRLHYSARDRSGSTLLVYMLKDDFSWLLKHTIPIDDLIAKPSNPSVGSIKRIVTNYRKEAWFNFYAFHPNCDRLFIITPGQILFYSPEEKFLEYYCCAYATREIVVGQNYNFPYSHCPIILRTAFQRTCFANPDVHVSISLTYYVSTSMFRIITSQNGLERTFDDPRYKSKLMHHLHPLFC